MYSHGKQVRFKHFAGNPFLCSVEGEMLPDFIVEWLSLYNEGIVHFMKEA